MFDHLIDEGPTSYPPRYHLVHLIVYILILKKNEQQVLILTSKYIDS